MGRKSRAINPVKTNSVPAKIRRSAVVISLRRCYRTKNRIMGRTSMRLMSLAFRGLVFAALAGLSACNTSSPTNILGVGGGDKNKDLAPPPSDTITESELRAFCPNVELREGTAFFTKYEKGGAATDTTEADKTKVIHQASLGEVTRACTYSGDTLTMNVAAAGRLVPGPKAVAGPVTLPIRVAVTSGETVLYSQLTQFLVTVDPASGAATFVFNDPNVNLPKPTDRSYRVFVGFDEGAPKAVKKKAGS
jgi:hypothetical protein